MVQNLSIIHKMLFSLIYFLTIPIICLKFVSGQSCRPGESTNGGRCYRFMSTAASFNSAENTCRIIGYDLVSIHSAFENGFLQGEASTQFESPSGLFFIGLNSSDTIIWSWTDNSDFNYWNWLPGMPAGDNQCAAFLIAEGKWITYPCNDAIQFVCAGNAGGTSIATTLSPLPSVPSSPNRMSTTMPVTWNPCSKSTLLPSTFNPNRNLPASLTTSPGACSDGWIYNSANDLCYTYKSYDMDYEELSTCNGSIHSLEEDYFVGAMMTSFLHNDCCFKNYEDVLYIVGQIRNSSQGVVWQNGEKFDYHPGWEDDDPKYTTVIATVDSFNQSIWAPFPDSDFYKVPPPCQYFLCKRNRNSFLKQ